MESIDRTEQDNPVKLSRSILIVAWFWILLGLFFACSATKFPVQVLKPAEAGLIGIKRIAVAQFQGEGNSGAQARSLLTSRLRETKFFDVLEQEKLSNLNERQLHLTSMVNPDSAQKIGKFLGVDALIYGKVTSYQVEPDERGVEKVRKQVWTGEYERDKDGKIVIEQDVSGNRIKKKKYKEEWVDQYYRIRRGEVSVTFRVVDVETGQLVMVKPITKSYNSGKVAEDSMRSLPSYDQILNDLLKQLIDTFVVQIVPHYVTERRVIEDGEGPIRIGKEFAQSGLWPRALEVWKQAEKLYPDNPAVYYNLGLAYEVTGELNQAEILYKKATMLKQKKLYQKALANIRKARKEKIKLMKQLQEREK